MYPAELAALHNHNLRVAEGLVKPLQGILSTLARCVMLLCSGHVCCGAERLHICQDATRALVLASGAAALRLQVLRRLGYLRPSGSTA